LFREEEDDEFGMVVVGMFVVGMVAVGMTVGRGVVGAALGMALGALVRESDTSTIKSGHDEMGPIKGFIYKHEHCTTVPRFVGTLTRSPERAQIIKSSSSSSIWPVEVKTQ
jgi:hypothetical protein